MRAPAAHLLSHPLHDGSDHRHPVPVSIGLQRGADAHVRPADPAELVQVVTDGLQVDLGNEVTVHVLDSNRPSARPARYTTPDFP